MPERIEYRVTRPRRGGDISGVEVKLGSTPALLHAAASRRGPTLDEMNIPSAQRVFTDEGHAAGDGEFVLKFPFDTNVQHSEYRVGEQARRAVAVLGQIDEIAVAAGCSDPRLVLRTPRNPEQPETGGGISLALAPLEALEVRAQKIRAGMLSALANPTFRNALRGDNPITVSVGDTGISIEVSGTGPGLLHGKKRAFRQGGEYIEFEPPYRLSDSPFNIALFMAYTGIISSAR